MDTHYFQAFISHSALSSDHVILHMVLTTI
jgi:hypothetical protein